MKFSQEQMQATLIAGDQSVAEDLVRISNLISRREAELLARKSSAAAAAIAQTPIHERLAARAIGEVCPARQQAPHATGAGRMTVIASDKAAEISRTLDQYEGRNVVRPEVFRTGEDYQLARKQAAGLFADDGDIAAAHAAHVHLIEALGRWMPSEGKAS